MQSMLLAGLAYEDCLTLKDKFVERKSLSFVDFKEAWHRVGFYSVTELVY